MFDDLFVKPNRMSSLGVTEYCGLAGILGSRYGAGRNAVMGQAYHARISGHPAPRLTPEEQETVESWPLPVETEASDGTKLRVADAERELEVKIGLGNGQECVGHLDCAWAMEIQRLKGEPCRVAYIVDFKKSLWTSAGPNSLQVLAYALAFARGVGADYFSTCIYVAESGEWHWSEEVFQTRGPDAERLLSRIRTAALNLSTTGSTGAHCRDCWHRLHCPEWTTYAEQTTEPKDLTERLLRAQARKEVAERIIENVQEEARRGAVIKDESTGKRYLPVNMPGRKSLDREALFKELPQASKFEKIGKPYQQFRWLNDKEKT